MELKGVAPYVVLEKSPAQKQEYVLLDKLLERMKEMTAQNPEVHSVVADYQQRAIYVHTDARGTKVFALEVSHGQGRPSESTMKWLGIDQDRLLAVGGGLRRD